MLGNFLSFSTMNRGFSMRRVMTVLLTCVLGLVLLTGSFTGSATAQKGDKGDKDDTKAKLPPYWKALTLSGEQKVKLGKIQKEYGTKIEELKKQLKKLESEEKQKQMELLTDGQKDQLRKIYLDKLGIDPFAPAPKDPETKKDPDTKKDPEVKKDSQK
jgi:hypothetical protein